MYRVGLINLSPDARSVVTDGAHHDFPSLPEAEMRTLLVNFCELDPVQNATADPEIRVQIRHESFLIRTESRKIILYDMLNREHPGLPYSVDEAMAELNGSAVKSRTKAPFAINRAREPGVSRSHPPTVEVRRQSVVRQITLVIIVGALAAALVYLRATAVGDELPANFSRVGAAERPALLASLAGVYVTGGSPEGHGITLTTAGDLKLFELAAVDAPRLVQAGYQLGRIGPVLCLATDQPGGPIMVKGPDTLGYCGEIYQRIR